VKTLGQTKSGSPQNLSARICRPAGVSGGPVQAQRQTKSVCHCACVGRFIFYYGAKKPQSPVGGFLAPLKGRRGGGVGGGSFRTHFFQMTSRILGKTTELK